MTETSGSDVEPLEFTITFSELDYQDDYYQYCTLLKQLTGINPDDITQSDFLKHLEIVKTNPLHKIIIAKYKKNIIGSVTLLIEPKFIHDLSYVAHIEDVVVHSECRGFGIGKHMIMKAVEVSKEYGCYKVILDCSDDCVEFYKKCGFKVKEHHMALYF